MNSAITATRPGRTFACVACDLNYGPHACAEFTAPVTERASIRAHTPRSGHSTDANAGARCRT